MLILFLPNIFALRSKNFMAFFLPSSTSTSTSTTTSLSSSPLPVIRPLDSEDENHEDGNDGSLRHHRSDADFPSTRSGFTTMFGLLNRRIEYISGASASDISSLESSDSEVELWTRRATDEDEFDDRHTNTRRTSRSTRDARSPSGRWRSPDDVHDDPLVELSVGTSRSRGGGAPSRTSTTEDHTGPGPSTSTSEPNDVVASPTNQIEGEEIVTVKRRRNRRRHGSTEVDHRRRSRRVKLRNRHDSHLYYDGFICKFTKKNCCCLPLFFLFYLPPIRFTQKKLFFFFYIHSMQHEIFSLLLLYVLDWLVLGWCLLVR